VSQRMIRRFQRTPYLGPVRISWEDEHGLPKYAQGTCLDFSAGGLRIEAPQPIPVRSIISLRADRINLGGSATVKRVSRRGSKYVLGLELSQTLRDQSLAVIGDPLALRKPVSMK
jgi:hypothetical protein